jgi:hypothetical protein
VIALPPSNGGVKDTVICSSPGTTSGGAGADGAVLGITALDTGEAEPAPFAFFAVTVHMYDLPLVNPSTPIGELTPEAEPKAPPFDDAQIAS